MHHVPAPAQMAPLIPFREPVTPTLEQLLQQSRIKTAHINLEFPSHVLWGGVFDHEILSASKRRKIAPLEEELGSDLEDEANGEFNANANSYDGEEVDASEEAATPREVKKPPPRSVRTSSRRRRMYYRTEETKKCWICQRASQDAIRKPCMTCRKPTCPHCLGPAGDCPACAVEKLCVPKNNDLLVRSVPWSRAEIKTLVEISGCTTRISLKDLGYQGWLTLLQAVPGRSISGTSFAKFSQRSFTSALPNTEVAFFKGIWKMMYRHDAEVRMMGTGVMPSRGDYFFDTR